MYRRNEMNEGNESCISDESCSGRKSCAGNGVPTNVGWQSQRTTRSIYSPHSSHRKSSCFTRKTTSHPAHTSNLGKVGTVPYISRLLRDNYWEIWHKKSWLMNNDHGFQQPDERMPVFRTKRREVLLDIRFNSFRRIRLTEHSAKYLTSIIVCCVFLNPFSRIHSFCPVHVNNEEGELQLPLGRKLVGFRLAARLLIHLPNGILILTIDCGNGFHSEKKLADVFLS